MGLDRVLSPEFAAFDAPVRKPVVLADRRHDAIEECRDFGGWMEADLDVERSIESIDVVANFCFDVAHRSSMMPERNFEEACAALLRHQDGDLALAGHYIDKQFLPRLLKSGVDHVRLCPFDRVVRGLVSSLCLIHDLGRPIDQPVCFWNFLGVILHGFHKVTMVLGNQGSL